MQVQVALKRNKSRFLDREAVENIVGKDAAKILTKAGSYTRQRARSLLKVSKRQRGDAEFYNQKQPSPPGKPPRSWSEHPVQSLRNVQYQFDPARMSVLIGPLALRGSHGAIPGVHERGESIGIPEWRFQPSALARSWVNWRKHRGTTNIQNKWMRGVPSKRRRHALSHVTIEQRVRMASYPARPFMGPALAKVAPKFPSLFARPT